MKFLLVLFFFNVLIITGSYGQNMKIDSLVSTAGQSSNDTASLNRISQYSNEIAFHDPANALLLDQKILYIARQKHYDKIEADALNSCGEDYHFLGDYADGLKMQFEALLINRQMKDSSAEGETLGLIGILYNELAEYRQALQYLIPADSIYQKLPGIFQGCFILANIGDAYDSLKITDSALYYMRESYHKFAEPYRSHLRSFILRHMGNIYAQIGKNDSALDFYNRAILNCRISNDQMNMTMALKKIADVYTARGMYDSGVYYAHRAFATAQNIPSKLQVLKASDLLAVLYNKTHEPDSALLYMRIAAAMKDSLYGPDKFHKLQILLLDEQQHQYSIRQQEQEFRNRIKYISLLTASGIFLLIAFILLRTNRHKQKANILLQQQKRKIEETLAELKSAQSQLIQSEKMASLGELTAGIAHEIQNPLNFVNNFSEVNKELIEELKGERQKAEGERNTFLENEILNDIEANEEKINHHGKRADAIVKGMLQHSRSSTGVKEATDVNKLADEYLRLSFHGLRAKDNSFNATMKTDFGESVGEINIISQDIGRVLLNLYNNAFYAIGERKKTEGLGYEPTVSVSTKKSGNQVSISVSDNGNGIPQKALDKIFQPFFTTKPTGQGTGLGLSLSYDIIKAHGGEIKVETKEGEGSVFIIQIPNS
jgi:two-component system NtrC family sensor kinase